MTKRDELNKGELENGELTRRIMAYCQTLDPHSSVDPSELARALGVNEGIILDKMDVMSRMGYFYSSTKRDSGERGYKVNCACLEGLNSDSYLEEIARSCFSHCALHHMPGSEEK
jgi:hypothetical protein